MAIAVKFAGFARLAGLTLWFGSSDWCVTWRNYGAQTQAVVYCGFTLVATNVPPRWGSFFCGFASGFAGFAGWAGLILWFGAGDCCVTWRPYWAQIRAVVCCGFVVVASYLESCWGLFCWGRNLNIFLLIMRWLGA